MISGSNESQRCQGSGDLVHAPTLMPCMTAAKLQGSRVVGLRRGLFIFRAILMYLFESSMDDFYRRAALRKPTMTAASIPPTPSLRLLLERFDLKSGLVGTVIIREDE